MSDKTSQAKLRKKVLSGRGIQLEKHTRKPITHDEVPAPYTKTPLMKFVELKYEDTLENLLWSAPTIYAVGDKIGIDPTTVSKWRKLIKDARFFAQFKEE